MTLREFIQVAYRRKLLIVLVTLAVGAASFVFASRQSPSFEAAAQVYIDAQDLPSLLMNTSNPDAALPPDRFAAIQAQLARVPPVAAHALTSAGVRDLTPSRLLAESSVVADPNTGLLTFSVTNRSPQRAERLSIAYARAFIAYRYRLQRSPFVAGSRQLTLRLAKLRAQHLASTGLFRSLTSSRKRLATFAALQTADATLVGSPTSAHQVQPRKMRALAIGLPLGLLLGLAAALLLYVLDTRARTLAEAERALDLGPLGWVPALPRRQRQRLAMLDPKGGRYRDAFAAVRTNVDLALRLHNGSDDGGAALLATTVGTRGGGAKSAIVGNLAVAFARAGLGVVLVDLDLRQPAIAGLLGLEPRAGVHDVLLGRASVEEALVPVPIGAADGYAGALHVLPATVPVLDPGDVVGTRRVGDLLDELRRSADLVIIDVPPVLDGSDAVAISVHANAFVVIAQVGRDRRSMLAEARRRLAASPVTVLGFVGVGKGAPERAYVGTRADLREPAPSRAMR